MRFALAELLKLFRMIKLAARHSTTRRLALAALVGWLVKRLVRLELRQRAADKLALELCAESEKMGLRRVQSVQARLETIHEAQPRARVAASGSNLMRRAQSVGMRRAQSVGNLVRDGILKGHGSSKLPFGPVAVKLEDLAMFPGLRNQKLCGDCLSRCTSALPSPPWKRPPHPKRTELRRTRPRVIAPRASACPTAAPLAGAASSPPTGPSAAPEASPL
jgi:hypothetical protein